ncbi:putative zinc-binding protein [Bordetella sp. BOR01]|uniref:putative zinc-binding protein n=1 Tax=Bordetella sp. BOR01 TaxID=2854779 RepID=UPI001C44BE1F|nr:putative zinc-binding protein [Bordetella sp. BOR01]MBV7486998.1 putative zinc-binding protein [Bordetella sp. BOR01]
MSSPTLPLVYSCSGCSSVAQLANYLAVRLDHESVAEMSCISGVGGGVPLLVKRARSGRPILALDGCVLACVKACLEKVGVEPTRHMVLNQFGATKRYHQESTEAERTVVWQAVFIMAQQMGEVASTQP